MCLQAVRSFAFVIFAPAILHISRVEAAVMGAVLGAVSPAVVIPRMVQLMEKQSMVQSREPADDHGGSLL